MFALEGIQANCELNYCVCVLWLVLRRHTSGYHLLVEYVWVSVSVCVRCTQASRHKAIKVAEMASQGADTIPRVHRFCLESVWTPVCCKRSCILSLLAMPPVSRRPSSCWRLLATAWLTSRMTLSGSPASLGVGSLLVGFISHYWLRTSFLVHWHSSILRTCNWCRQIPWIEFPISKL